MATAAPEAPETFHDAASALAAASASGQPVRIVGSGTKLGWGSPSGPHGGSVELHTTGLDELLEHNAGDLTATVQAGMPLADAQRAFAAEGQMLALDPPLHRGDAPSTIGGVFATGDSGPLAHRYGGPRDLVIGATVALSDGTIASSGGKVIKNVAGYDLAKLFCGAFGTLGLILAVSVRLHPLYESSATTVGSTDDPDALAAAAKALAALPVESESLDIAWGAGHGQVLVRCAGREHDRRAARTAKVMTECRLEEVAVDDDDGELWESQRAGQRSADQALVRVAAAPTALAGVLRSAEAAQATAVGRAALGTTFLTLAPEAVGTVRDALPAGAAAVVLDAPPDTELDRWGPVSEPALELMRRVKVRFDPTNTCNPGLFVGGI